VANGPYLWKFAIVLIGWYACALLLGLAFGVAVAGVFRLLVPKGMTGRYWNGIARGVHGLLHGDHDHFWKYYFGIVGQSTRYVGRQLLALLLATVPLILAANYAGPMIWRMWDAGAPWAVYPQDAGRVLNTEFASDAGRAPEQRRALALKGGSSVSLPDVPGSVAVCATGAFSCMALQALGFQAVYVPPQQLERDSTIVVRSWHDDWNPLWPYLNDPEFIFLVGLSLAWVALLAKSRRTSADGGESHRISNVDFALTQLASAGANVIRRVGDLETRLNGRRLGAQRIDRPVFISGLARSGTTILLEKLSQLEGVATHRYRDFPFVMTPLYWSRFVSLFGKDHAAVERPHRDSIRITRESPEAFEEPIWQHFFPHLHDPAASHALTATEGSEGFAAFYRDHIRKILLLRGGRRYVSKGNYNLTRLGYLAKLFPDALFLVPVRHPLTHIESLVRQHELFCRYSASDDRIAAYLRSVGHYEFGPQRTPIAVNRAGTLLTLEHWAAGNDAGGYAQQWSDLYGFVIDLLRRDPQLARRVRIVRYEDLTDDPEREFRRILEFSGLGDPARAAVLASGVQAPARDQPDPGSLPSWWSAVEEVAVVLGYTRNPRARAEPDATIICSA
jgi:hypothetical protein